MVIQRILFIFKLLVRRIRRKCGNRDLEKLEQWYANNYLMSVDEVHRGNIRVTKFGTIDHAFEFKLAMRNCMKDPNHE